VKAEQGEERESKKTERRRTAPTFYKDSPAQPKQHPVLEAFDIEPDIVEVLGLIPMDAVGMSDRPANRTQHDYD
jgi:hypothetical protein